MMIIHHFMFKETSFLPPHLNVAVKLENILPLYIFLTPPGVFIIPLYEFCLVREGLNCKFKKQKILSTLMLYKDWSGYKILFHPIYCPWKQSTGYLFPLLLPQSRDIFLILTKIFQA